jgi:predicted CoA-binding protein
LWGSTAAPFVACKLAVHEEARYTLRDVVASTPEQILRYARTIAVVGASRDPGKSAASVPLALQGRGFRIIPVNPFAETLMGERVYKSLVDIGEKVDVVDVFRPSADAPAVARQAAAIGARALWLQQGITSDEARRIAEAAGMDYVEDRCMAVEAALHRVRAPGNAG